MALQIKNIDLSKIRVYENQKKDPTQFSQTFRIKYVNEKDQLVPFYIQTPKMVTPFGISHNEKWLQKDSDRKKWTIMLALDPKDEKVTEFRKKWKEIETQILKIFMDEFADKFLDDIEADDDTTKFAIIRSKLYSSIKKFKKKEGAGDLVYPDNFQATVPWKISPTKKELNDPDKVFNEEDNVPQSSVNIYDKNIQLSSYTNVVPKSKVITIIHLNGISLVTNRLSFSVKLNQLQYFPPDFSPTLSGFHIKNDEESENSENEDGSSVEVNNNNSGGEEDSCGGSCGELDNNID